MTKKPKLLNFPKMQNIFEPHFSMLKENIFINKELVVLNGNPSIFRLIIQQDPPFMVDDHRLGIIAQGEARVNINLVEKHLTAGTIVFIGPGSILSPISFSDDLSIYGFGLSPDYPLPFGLGQVPPSFNGQVRDFQIPVSDDAIAIARHIVDTIWRVVHQPAYNRQTVNSLVAAQISHYDGLYQQYSAHLQTTRSREQTIFDRFIYLINKYSTQEHRLGFYAGKMCLTERYLSTVIRQASGTTAKEWVDRSLITRIKAELRHSDRPISQISEDMHFPNPSFFNKYFKRLTGMTPLQFRERG